MSQPNKSQRRTRNRCISLAGRTHRDLRPGQFLRASILTLLCLAFGTRLLADTISGTVKDPSGAVVAGARIEITGGDSAQPIVLTSDESGKFSAPNLSAGKYSVRVAKEGFDELVTTVDLQDTAESSAQTDNRGAADQRHRHRKEHGLREFRSRLPPTPRHRPRAILSVVKISL